jgi:hypothetical protein
MQTGDFMSLDLVEFLTNAKEFSPLVLLPGTFAVLRKDSAERSLGAQRRIDAGAPVQEALAQFCVCQQRFNHDTMEASALARR